MADGLHGQVGHHAAALVGWGYPKDNVPVLTPYRSLVEGTAMVTIEIWFCESNTCAGKEI